MPSVSPWFRFVLWQRKTPQQTLREALAATIISKTFFRFDRRHMGSLNNHDDVQKALSHLRVNPDLATIRVQTEEHSLPPFLPLFFFLVARAPIDVIQEVHSMYPGAASEVEGYRDEMALHVACRHYSANLEDGRAVIRFLAEAYPQAAAHLGRQGYPLDVVLENVLYAEHEAEEVIRFLVELHPGAVKQRRSPQLLLHKAWKEVPSMGTMELLAQHMDENCMDEFHADVHNGGRPVIILGEHRAAILSSVILPRFKRLRCEKVCWIDEGLVHLLTALHKNKGTNVETLHIGLPHVMSASVKEAFRAFLRHNRKSS